METMLENTDKKRCSRCKLVKSKEDFYKNRSRLDGLGDWCKSCKAIFGRSYNKKNRKKIAIAQQKRREKHPEKRIEYRRKNHTKIVLRKQEYYKRNKVRYAECYRNRYKINPSYRLAQNIARVMRFCLNGRKNSRTFDMLGYSVKELKSHLQRHFQEGMNWSNYGKWHVDHVIPISAFNFDSQECIDFKRCWALDNLRPMWARENWAKGAKLSKPFQPSLKLAFAVP